MLSSMCPTMVYARDAELITGTPGGPRIFTTLFQVIMNCFVYGQALHGAVDRPRFHHQLLPKDQIDVERNRPLAAETLDGLGAMGYSIRLRDPSGDVQSILLRRREGSWRGEAVSDPRGIGAAFCRKAGGE
jgi:gamma-glutamyltranspeptidase/glutathione hydrolase